MVKKYLNNKNFNPSYNNNQAFLLAVKNGSYKVVEILIKDKRIDPTDNNNAAFLHAQIFKKINNDHYKTREILIKDSIIKPEKLKNEIFICDFFRKNNPFYYCHNKISNYNQVVNILTTNGESDYFNNKDIHSYHYFNIVRMFFKYNIKINFKNVVLDIKRLHRNGNGNEIIEYIEFKDIRLYLKNNNNKMYKNLLKKYNVDNQLLIEQKINNF
jgi:hypothetical protein